MMITIKDIWIKQGYSGADHLNDDGPAQDIIGRSYASVRDARLAAYRAAAPGNATNSPVGIEIAFADGSTRKV